MRIVARNEVEGAAGPHFAFANDTGVGIELRRYSLSGLLALASDEALIGRDNAGSDAGRTERNQALARDGSDVVQVVSPFRIDLGIRESLGPSLGRESECDIVG